MSLEELFKGRGIDLPSSMGHLKKIAKMHHEVVMFMVQGGKTVSE